MVNELVFNETGPIISGSWMNYKTGDYFTVRDCFMQDNQIVILTTDNRSFNYDMMQDYVQVNNGKNDLSDMSREIKEKNASQSIATDIPKEVMDLIQSTDVDTYDYKETSKTGNAVGDFIAQNQLGQSQINAIDGEDLLFIKRVLRNVSTPEIKVDVDLNYIPNDKIEILVNTLGVDISNIAEWLIKDIDINDIKNAIKIQIINSLTKKKGKNTQPSISDLAHPTHARKKTKKI